MDKNLASGLVLSMVAAVVASLVPLRADADEVRRIIRTEGVIEHSVPIVVPQNLTTTEKIVVQETTRCTSARKRTTAVRKRSYKRSPRVAHRRVRARRYVAHRAQPVRTIERTITKTILVEKPTPVYVDRLVEKPVFIDRVVEKPVIIRNPVTVERTTEVPMLVEPLTRPVIVHPVTIKEKCH